jgi:hypothetical protein
MIAESVIIVSIFIVSLFVMSEWKHKYELGIISSLVMILFGIMLLTDGIQIQTGATSIITETSTVAGNETTTSTNTALSNDYSNLTMPILTTGLLGSLIAVIGAIELLSYSIIIAKAPIR